MIKKKHETKVNRTYKDRLFRLVFGEKEALLELYNAVNGSRYTDPEELEITTLDDVIYMGMKNDLSFLIAPVLNLYEHQASHNPNMPVRGLFYFSDLYRSYIERHKLNLYSSRQIKLPLPRYLVFYNGLKKEPDRSELRLTDAFMKQSGQESCIEVVTVMLNINLGHNKELMERCRKLNEYARFVARIREDLEQGMSLREAADETIEYCIQESVLLEFLSLHRAEVRNMILEEYDEQSHIASERQEAYEEGREEGRESGMTEGMANAVLALLKDLGEIPDSLRGRVLEQRNPDILNKWLKAASRSETIELFREQME